MCENNEECPCKKIKCGNHGKCEQCRARHTALKKSLPACDRIKERAAKREERRKR